jgi:hypothetical protein
VHLEAIVRRVPALAGQTETGAEGLDGGDFDVGDGEKVVARLARGRHGELRPWLGALTIPPEGAASRETGRFATATRGG